MGYRCPVCESPQADGEHLANHLAFTAMLHGGEHEEWLDDRAPGWSEGGPEDLIPVVTERAEEAEVETVFEDATGRDPGRGPSVEDALSGDGPAPDEETRRIVEEARELTERMYEGRDGESAEE